MRPFEVVYKLHRQVTSGCPFLGPYAFRVDGVIAYFGILRAALPVCHTDPFGTSSRLGTCG
jgi:hypothetical protein